LYLMSDKIYLKADKDSAQKMIAIPGTAGIIYIDATIYGGTL